MATVTRGRITRSDLANWDGKTATYARPDATGGTVTALAVGNAVDVLEVYGAGTSRTRGTIANAVQRIGTSAVSLQFAPGTWTIDDDLTVPSNFSCHVPAGCIFDVSSGKTLTFNGPFFADSETYSSGSGSVVFVGHYFLGAKPRIYYETTAAETAAGVTPVDKQYPEADWFRYGAVGDWSSSTDTDGLLATSATDNLAALEAVRDVLEQKGGGVIRCYGGGDHWLSDSFICTDISNIYLYIEPGTTLRNTRYTSGGVTINFGQSDPDTPITNVGVFGGGTIRNFRPDHDTVPAWQATTPYSVGDYVLSTDTNAEERAYYCKVAGTSGSVAPSVINGGETDGTVQWQDADNDNAIGATGSGVYIDQMHIPECSGKFITVQRPQWSDVWITRNRCGGTNDKGIEVKGQQGISGQAGYFGEGTLIGWNVVEETGREGVEVEQSSFGNNRNNGARILSNTVKSAGVIASASGMRINRCDNVELRGNRVLDSTGNGYHIRKCKNVRGDLDTESAGTFGVHMQECEDWAFDFVRIVDPVTEGFRENADVGGGYIGRLLITGSAHTDGGYRATSRAGSAPVIASHSVSAGAGSAFVGDLPTLMDNVLAAKLQSFILDINNDVGTIKHRFIDDLVNAGFPSQYIDRITGASETLTVTPTGSDASTAFANGGKISSANASEFILNHANAAIAAHGVKSSVIIRNSSTVDLNVGFIRRSVDVNGATLTRWHLQFRNATSGAVYDLTTLGSGLSISVQVTMYLP